MRFTMRPEGWVRVSLPDADVEASRLVSAALDELFGGGALARYVVSRRVVAGRWPWSRARPAWHAVPADLARRKDRAEAFHGAWRRWLGDGELVYCHGAGERGRALARPGVGRGDARDAAAAHLALSVGQPGGQASPSSSSRVRSGPIDSMSVGSRGPVSRATRSW